MHVGQVPCRATIPTIVNTVDVTVIIGGSGPVLQRLVVLQVGLGGYIVDGADIRPAAVAGSFACAVAPCILVPVLGEIHIRKTIRGSRRAIYPLDEYLRLRPHSGQ